MTEKPLQGPGSRLKPLACGKCGVPDSGQTISKNPPPNDRPLERTLLTTPRDCEHCFFKRSTMM